jgi:hypothetical protein
MNKELKGPAHQRGVSKLGLLIIGIFIASTLTVGLKVAPAYMDNGFVNGLADDLVNDGTADRLQISEIRQRFADSLRINGIYDFDLSDIEIRRNGGQTTIRIAYERRMPLIANLDIVAVFDHTAQ